MQLKNNKILVILFRICILTAFFTGLMYFIKFVNGSNENAFSAVVSFFYAYMGFTLVSCVLSIICFKTTSTVSSVVRTISLAVTSIVLLMNMSFIGLMNKVLQTEAGNYEQLMELNNQAQKIANDSSVMGKALLSFAGVFVMLVLSITSIVTLIKTLKGNA